MKNKGFAYYHNNVGLDRGVFVHGAHSCLKLVCVLSHKQLVVLLHCFDGCFLLLELTGKQQWDYCVG